MTAILTLIILTFVAFCVLIAVALCRDSSARERAQGHHVRGVGTDMAESRRERGGDDDHGCAWRG